LFFDGITSRRSLAALPYHPSFARASTTVRLTTLFDLSNHRTMSLGLVGRAGVSGLLIWAVSSWPARAHAAEPVPEAAALAGPRTAGALQFGLGSRYGFSFEDDAPDPWGTGLGVDLGYTFPAAWYLGAGVEYFFGNDDYEYQTETNTGVFQFAVEVGYDFGLGEAVVRPKLGIGYAALAIESCSRVGPSGTLERTCSDESEGGPAAIPGFTIIVPAGRFHLLLDARNALVFAQSRTWNALIVALGFGF
jgi:hypothetical protein